MSVHVHVVHVTHWKIYYELLKFCLPWWRVGGGEEGEDRKYGYSMCFEVENTCSVLSKLIQNIYFRCFTAAHTYKTHIMENELFF